MVYAGKMPKCNDDGCAGTHCANRAVTERQHHKQTKEWELNMVAVVVLAAEVGGRSAETAEFLTALAKACAQEVPQVLQGWAETAWVKRWSAILACTAARAFTISLLDRRPVSGTGEAVPSVQEVLREVRFL